jgi:hypothetical protein
VLGGVADGKSISHAVLFPQIRTDMFYPVLANRNFMVVNVIVTGFAGAGA